MSRPIALFAAVLLFAHPQTLLAQLNPAGFLDPAGASRAGTAAPPNTTIGPIGGSTLPPGASSSLPPGAPREIETNPALRQEVRRPFGGGGYRRSFYAPIPGEDVSAQAARNANLSERQNLDRAAGNAVGAATGKLAQDWRYVYSQGRHWYWMPNNAWQVWYRSAWTPYRPGMFSRPIFGYGTQVRGYRPVPPDFQGGQPTSAPFRAETATGSGPGPSMPNEHFISR